MRNEKIFRTLCAFLAAGMTLAPGQGVSAEEAEPAAKKKIAVLTYSFSSEYWGYVEQGCEAYERGNPGIEITAETPSSSVASEEQLVMLQSDLEAGRYDGYVIAAINQDMVEKALEDADVPVVACDSVLEADCVIGCIGTDNELAAAAGAKKAVGMAEELGWDEIGCVMISGREDDSNNQSRVDGYRQGIEEAGGKWLEAVYPTDKSVDTAKEAMEQIMSDYPDGVAIVCCYNDVLAEAALCASAYNEAFENTVFLGFDGNGSVCERIMNDDAYAHFVTVAQNPYEMGYNAVDILAQYFAGTQQDVTYKDSGYSVITRENARERMVQIQSHLS